MLQYKTLTSKKLLALFKLKKALDAEIQTTDSGEFILGDQMTDFFIRDKTSGVAGPFANIVNYFNQYKILNIHKKSPLPVSEDV